MLPPGGSALPLCCKDARLLSPGKRKSTRASPCAINCAVASYHEPALRKSRTVPPENLSHAGDCASRPASASRRRLSLVVSPRDPRRLPGTGLAYTAAKVIAAFHALLHSESSP